VRTVCRDCNSAPVRYGGAWFCSDCWRKRHALSGAQWRALAFVKEHPGYRVPAFPWGFGYRFDAPELKRAPFRLRTLKSLIAAGFVEERDDDQVVISPRGIQKLKEGHG